MAAKVFIPAVDDRRFNYWLSDSTEAPSQGCTKLTPGYFSSACLLDMATAQGRNNRPLSDAMQITDTSRGWTVLVQCLHKSRQKISSNGSDYKNYIFCDMKGTFISAVTYDQAIAKFSRLLEPYKKYYVSNAGVRTGKPEYQLGEYKYSWTLYPRTPVGLAPEPVPRSLPCKLELVKFTNMYRYADSDTPISFRALIIASTEVPSNVNYSVRDYVVINQEKKPMSLRIWSDILDSEEFNVSSRLPQPTIIVGINCKITTHHGLSLTTRKNAFFLNNPPFMETDPLLAWYTRNAVDIKSLLSSNAHLDVGILLPPPADDMIVPLKDFETNRDTVKASWVAATMYLLPGQEKLWYSACPTCGKSFEAQVGWKTTCTGCNEEIELQPRCHIGVFLNDETGTIEATMFSPEAEKMTQFTGLQIKDAADKNAPLTDEIERRIHKKPVICYVKHYEKSFRGTVERSCPIVKLYTQEDIAAARTHTQPQGSSSGTAVEPLVQLTPSPVKEKQFFSPKTKSVLDEAAAKATQIPRSPSKNLSPKRSLLFPELCVTDLSSAPSPESTCTTSTPTPANSASAERTESPGKKMKEQERI